MNTDTDSDERPGNPAHILSQSCLIRNHYLPSLQCNVKQTLQYKHVLVALQ